MNSERTAVVTGAANGIGWAIAQVLAEEAEVVLIDRAEEVNDRASELLNRGLKARPMMVDLSNLDAVSNVIDRVRQTTGRCDILVNNAGVHTKNNGEKFSFAEITLDNWDFSFRLNLTAPFLLCQGFLPLMQSRRWGRVINIASRAGRTYAPPAGAQYSASKAGMIGMTRTIAGEYGRDGITANCIAPGRTATSMSMGSSQAVQVLAAQEMIIGRTGNTKEIAAIAKFLASDDSGFVTGAVIDANGGSFMAP